jgi:GAF domain-containing protein
VVSEESQLEESLAALSQFFVGDKTMVQTLERVADMTQQAVPQAALVGLTMLTNGKLATAVFTDPEAPQIDQAQYQSGRGPCVESFRTGETLPIESTDEDERWPEFSAACVAHGIHSTLSLPLSIEGTTYGAMNLYSTQVRGFAPEDVATARLFAAQAAVVLANAVSYWAARVRSEQLEHALSSRAEIEQAKGIIMSTMRCNADEAFQVMVEQSQRENRKLRDVAAEVVTRTIRKADPPR